MWGIGWRFGSSLRTKSMMYIWCICKLRMTQSLPSSTVQFWKTAWKASLSHVLKSAQLALCTTGSVSYFDANIRSHILYLFHRNNIFILWDALGKAIHRNLDIPAWYNMDSAHKTKSQNNHNTTITMALQVLPPAFMTTCHFAENDWSPSLMDIESPRKIQSTESRSNFFEEQTDITSEIMSFLDVTSLLNVCQASKVFSSCLRHDHVIISALSTTSPSLPITPQVSKSMFALNQEKMPKHDVHKNHEKKHILYVPQTREYSIMRRLLQVYEQYNSIKNSQSGALVSIAMQNVERPSPMRLLRLVNGQKCEKCYRRISPTTSSGGSVVLPSLTFGKFCCTKCLF